MGRTESEAKGRQAAARDVLASFEREIGIQEDILYGVALLFEGMSLVYQDVPEIIESHRKEFGDIIENGRRMIEQARLLLEQAKKSSSKVDRLLQFVFAPCQGYPDAAEMTKRARILAKTYGEIFPSRPRSQAFTEEETFRLIEAASEKI